MSDNHVIKKSKGRQKIEMKKKTNAQHRQVTFSKRRNGVFKKATELCVLCGAELAIIVFSEGGKAFSFGHPGVETIVDRFMNGHEEYNPFELPVESDNYEHTQQEHRELVRQLEAEKKRGEVIEQMKKEDQWQHQFWWDAPVDDKRLDELERMRAAMEKVRNKVASRVDEMVMKMSSPSLLLENGEDS